MIAFPGTRVPVTTNSQKWSLATSIGSVLAAVAASSCCVGPVAFAMFSLGGAGLMMNLEPYRPIFMALTVVLLGFGFYRAYRRAPAPTRSESTECECVPPRRTMGRIVVWIATALVAGAWTAPYLSKFFATTEGG
jgi:mercuric ion transport protein